MSGAMRKIGEYLGLLEDTGVYDDEYDEQGYADRRAANSRRVVPRRPRRRSRHRSPTSPSVAARRLSAPAPVAPVSELSRITTLHPRTYNEARTVGENFRDGVPVIMNLSEMDDADAKRLVDFAAGLVFATRGTIERVTAKVFLLSPPNVSVAAEEKAAHRRGWRSSTRAELRHPLRPAVTSDDGVAIAWSAWRTRARAESRDPAGEGLLFDRRLVITAKLGIG